jgi:hypothetical protein
VYVDYFRSAFNDATVLPKTMAGMSIAVSDSMYATVKETTVPTDATIHVSTTGTNGRGFVVLKLTR